MEMENIEMIEETEAMEPEFDAYEVETEESGNGNTALGMLIGAGLALATTAAVKFGKKAWAKWKAKKESAAVAEEHDFVVPTDEEIAEVTTK